MAENNGYILILRNETGGGIAEEVGGAGGVQASGGGAGGETSGGLSPNAKKALRGALSVYRPLKSTANQLISYEVSQVELRTGSREQHQRANFAYSVGKTIYNAAESVAIGAIFGGLPGALTSLALSTLSSAISIAQNQETINTERRLEDITRNLSAQRVTVSGSRYMNASEF